MCILAFHFDEKRKTLTVAANRDEFYERPTAALHTWKVNNMDIYGGRDLKELGTWLATNSLGHFVAITNYRDPSLETEKPLSRGKIATDFLTANEQALKFAEKLQQNAELYGPFNVLMYDGETLVHYNNVFNTITKVPTGVHVISNATLNTGWPKAERLRSNFTDKLSTHFSVEGLLHILQDEQQAIPEHLPSTGVPYELEQALSSVFVRIPHYGTRCSTIVQIDTEEVFMFEQTYEKGIATTEKSLRFAIKR